jgi:1-acyl-sn-glycerol-3-phosphate acyltransferase
VPWFYYVGRALVRMLAFLVMRYQVKGKDNIPAQGPILVAANHLNLVDPPLLGISLGRVAVFMAKEELFRSKFSGYFVRGFGAFPVHRRQADRKALSQAEQVLAQGQALIMFPEGTRSRDGQLQSAFPGAALIASRCDVPILPVGISGTEKVKGMTWWLRRPRVTVSIGVPFSLPPSNGLLSREELAQHASLIMARIAELLPAGYRGKYSS